MSGSVLSCNVVVIAVTVTSVLRCSGSGCVWTGVEVSIDFAATNDCVLTLVTTRLEGGSIGGITTTSLTHCLCRVVIPDDAPYSWCDAR